MPSFPPTPGPISRFLLTCILVNHAEHFTLGRGDLLLDARGQGVPVLLHGGVQFLDEHENTLPRILGL